MNTLTINPHLFTEEYPVEEGVYLWKNSLGLEIINVKKMGAGYKYGIYFEEGFHVNGINVSRLRGTFLKLDVVKEK